MPQTTGSTTRHEAAEEDQEQEEKKNSSRRYQKGNAAFHDKTEAGIGIDGTGSSTGHIEAYQCPFCDFTDSSEEVVRGHITSEDDSRHKNRNGYLDQIYVHGVDADGEVIEDREPPGRTPIGNGNDETSLIPDGVDEDSIDADIIRTAITNPRLTYAEMARRASDDDNSVSGRRVRRVIEKHLGAVDAANGSRDERMENAGFYDATPMQRRVILSWLADPDDDRSSRDIADSASTSPRYPDQVIDRYTDTIDHLQAKLDVGSISFESLVKRADLDEPEKLTLPAGIVPDEVADELGIAVSDDGPNADQRYGGDLSKEDRIDIVKEAVRDYLDLTPKMQSAILAELADPTRTATERDDIAGVSMGYGSRVMDSHSDILDTLAWGVCDPELNFDPLDIYKVSVLSSSPDELDDVSPESIPDHSLEEIDLSGDTTRDNYPIENVDIGGGDTPESVDEDAEPGVGADEAVGTEAEDDAAPDSSDAKPETDTGTEADTASESEVDSAAATGHWISEEEIQHYAIIFNALAESARNEKESAAPGTPMQYAADRQLHILELVAEFIKSHRRGPGSD